MTIEEKAKRYDEALERARQVHTTNVNENKKSTEYIFPELRENYDEKIRKELITIYSVGAKGNMKTGDIPDRDIVAWLEKQGEQKPADRVEPKFKVGDWVMYKNGACFSDGSISARVRSIEGHKVWLEHGTYVDESELKRYENEGIYRFRTK